MKLPVQPIDKLFAFIVVDDDGKEGIPVYVQPMTGMQMPMIGAFTQDTIDVLRPYVQQWANQNKKIVELVIFEKRVEGDVIYPVSMSGLAN